MNTKFPIFSFLLLTVATAGAQVASHAPTVFSQAPAHSASAGKPVVRINGSVLTDTDLLREEYAIFPYARQHGGGIPKDLAPQIRDGALKMMVFEELVYQEALRQKLTIPPAKLQRAQADFRKQFSSLDEYKAFLQSEFQGSPQLLQDRVRRSLLIEAFLKTQVESKSVPTPAEIRAFYDKNPSRFLHPETYTFQTISILPPANATSAQLKEGKQRAESAFKQAKATRTSEDFGMLAEKISDDDYRVMMGQHKPVPADQLAPQVLQALRALKLGAVSDVIQIEQAYTIVHLEAHAPAGKTRFEEVRAQLAKELEQTKRNQLRSALDLKLRKDAKIEGM